MTFDRTLGRRNKPIPVEPTEWRKPPQVVLSDQPTPDLGDDDLVPDEPKPKAKVKRKTKASTKKE